MVESQYAKGRRYRFLSVMVFMPLLYVVLVSLFIFVVANYNAYLFFAEICVLAIYYFLSFIAFRSMRGMIFLEFLLFLFATLLLLISCLYLIIAHVPLSSSHVTVINFPAPFNWVIATIVFSSFLGYFIKKQFDININQVKKQLLIRKIVNTVDKTANLGRGKKISSVYQKKEKKNALWRRKSIKEKLSDLMSWLLLFIYYFVPISPFVLRGISHGKPISWIMLFGGLFWVWLLGYITQQFFGLYCAYTMLEKELGVSLRPIRD